MGIKVHEFLSLDGVFEDPRWTAGFGFDPAMGQDIGVITAGAGGILLGRKTFQMFAPAWSARTEQDDPGAPFFNETTKYVVSSTLTEADGWRNSTVLPGYDPERIAELAERVSGDLYVSGSGTLVRALLADGLIDELNLFIYPIVLGAGARLFADGRPPIPLSLTGCRSYDNGVVRLAYGGR